MKYPHAVKINGQIYPANTEIELETVSDVETETIVEPDCESENETAIEKKPPKAKGSKNNGKDD